MLGGLGMFDFVFMWVLFGGFWIGIPVGLFLLVRRFLRAYERRAAAPTELAELRSQIQELQGQVADLAIENARLREADRFTASLRNSSGSDSRPA